MSAAAHADAQADLEAGLPPEQLVPGDLVALDDAISNSQALGDQLAATARSIQYIELSGDDWLGLSRDAYDWAQDLDVRSFKDAAGVFDDVVTALAGYVSTLEGARGEAQVALTDYQRGKAQQAAAAWDCDPSPSASAPPLSASKVFDSDPSGIDGAVTKLLQARHSVELAGAAAAKSLRALADLAPQPHRPTVRDNLKNSVNGLFDPVVKLVRSPYDAFNDCSDYLSGFGHGSECVGDLGRAGMFVGLLATKGRAAEDDPFVPGGPRVKAPADGAGPGAAASTSSALLDNAARIESHLARLDHSPANDAMIARIQSAAADGRPLTEAQRHFMRHELTEAALMDQGMSYEQAHEIAGQTHPTFGNYDPEVIKEFPELFNQNWRNYWGIE